MGSLSSRVRIPLVAVIFPKMIDVSNFNAKPLIRKINEKMGVISVFQASKKWCEQNASATPTLCTEGDKDTKIGVTDIMYDLAEVQPHDEHTCSHWYFTNRDLEGGEPNKGFAEVAIPTNEENYQNLAKKLSLWPTKRKCGFICQKLKFWRKMVIKFIGKIKV